MLSISDPAAPPSPCPAPFNLTEYVLRAGLEVPDKIAMAVLRPAGASRLSHGALRAAVLGTAQGLLAQGLRPGDRVLLRLGNTPDFPIAFLAAIAVGLVPVPTSAQLTVPEITALCAQLRPAAILAARDIALPRSPVPVIGQDALRAMRDGPPAEFDMGDPDRPAYIVFTSGTSGQPRGVVHAHRAIWARRMMWDGWYGLRETDRLLHAGAFNWTYTLGTGLLDPWSRGATALIPAAGVGPELLPLLMRRHDATIFAAAPGVYRQMLRHPQPLLPRLRHGLSAGEKLPESLRADWTATTGLALHEAFGMSECSTFISGAPDRPAPPGTLGFAQPGRRVAILGPEGPVARGKEGIIAIHRDDPGLMLGYLDAPDETAARLRGEWFLTGDTGRMEPSGAITYLGRADDMMNAGGYRVSPVEVEAAMLAHPAIADCAAVELPVRKDVSVIALFFVPNGDVEEAELQRHAAERLARYKQPRLFRAIDSIPRGANNKILRRKLREEGTT